jgi:phosphoglycolate phosphatase
MPDAAPPPPLAVFDLDGTLVDSAPDIHAALDRLMAGLGLPGFARPEVTAMIGDGVRVLVERALAARGRAFDPAALARFTADYEANAAIGTRLFPGIAPCLDSLRQAGWRLAICTNKPSAATRALLRGLDLEAPFHAVVGGDATPARKPDPGHLLAAIAAAGGSPGRAVMIGDHRNDMVAARGAGVPAIFVGWGYGPAEMGAGAAARAETPERLPGLLAGLAGP